MTNNTSVKFWNDLTETQSEAINGGSRIRNVRIKQSAFSVIVGEEFKGRISVYQEQNANVGDNNQ